MLPEQGDVVLPALIELLRDAVHSGASVGFLAPLSDEEARLTEVDRLVFWQSGGLLLRDALWAERVSTQCS